MEHQTEVMIYGSKNGIQSFGQGLQQAPPFEKADSETDMTFNDYAEELLSGVIGRMYREYDRQGLIKEDEDD